MKANRTFWFLFFLSVLCTVVFGGCRSCRADEVTRPVVTVYGKNSDIKSRAVAADIRSGRFVNLGADFAFHDLKTMGEPAGLPGVPAFSVNGGTLFSVPGKYDGKKTFQAMWLQLHPAVPPTIPAGGVREIVDLGNNMQGYNVPITGRMKVKGEPPMDIYGNMLVPVNGMTTGNVNEQMFQDVTEDQRRLMEEMERPLQTEEETEPAEPMVDIDWAMIRFGVLVSGDSPKFVNHLRGPVQRVLDHLTGSQLTLEPISEAKEPERYQAVAEAVGSPDVDVYPFVLVGKVADVNLVRSVVLKKIERAIEDRDISNQYHFIPDFIFWRENHNEFYKVSQAMGPVRLGLYDTPDNSRGWLHSLIALLVTGGVGSHLVRAIRGFWSRRDEQVADNLDVLA